jgi:hypothetical protein
VVRSCFCHSHLLAGGVGQQPALSVKRWLKFAVVLGAALWLGKAIGEAANDGSWDGQ